MAKFNWEKVHTEDRDLRHRLSLELRKDISASPSIPIRLAQPLPNSKPLHPKHGHSQKFKICFQFEFKAPNNVVTKDWIIIQAIPQTMTLLSEKQVKVFIQQAVARTISDKSSSLGLRTIYTDTKFLLEVLWPRLGIVDKSVTNTVLDTQEQINRSAFRIKLNINFNVPVTSYTSKEWASLLSTYFSSLSEREMLETFQWDIARGIDAGVDSLSWEVAASLEK